MQFNRDKTEAGGMQQTISREWCLDLCTSGDITMRFFLSSSQEKGILPVK
jgi:hypothetical protein